MPWVHRIVPYSDSTDIVVVEGDVLELNRMFVDLPDRHPSASHATIASINDMLRIAHHRQRDRKFKGGHDAKFYQSKSFEETLRHVSVAGRDDVTAKAMEYLASPKMREEIAVYGRRATRPAVEMRDEGDEVDMDRMRAGEDDTAWRSIVRRETPRRSKVVVLETNIIIPAYVRQEQFVWNGVQCAVIVDALESEGYRVQVNALQVVSLSSHEGEPYKFISRVRVKRADEPLRIDLLAYQTGCAALTRTALWRCKHVFGGSIDGYGYNDVSDAEVRDIAMHTAPDHAKPDHILPAVWDEEVAIARIREVMANYQERDIAA